MFLTKFFEENILEPLMSNKLHPGKVMKLTEVGNLVLRGQIKCFTLNREWPACSSCPCFQNCEFARMFPPSEGNDPSIRYCYRYLLNQNWPVWEKQGGWVGKARNKSVHTFTFLLGWYWCFLVRCPSGIIAHWCFCSVWHNNWSDVWHNNWSDVWHKICVIEDELSPPSGPRTAPAVIWCSLHTCKMTVYETIMVVLWLKECHKTFKRTV